MKKIKPDGSKTIYPYFVMHLNNLFFLSYKKRSSPYINRFLSPDTIVPGAGNPQAFNRYSYVLNNPIRYNDPTGHKAECGDGPQTWAACKEQLKGFAKTTLKNLGGKDDLGALVKIVDKAAKLYGNYEDMMPELSAVFIGVRESNSFTVWNATQANGCAGVGRDPINCRGNAITGSFGDRGFNDDFQDTHNQIYHFWAYVATSASTDYPIGGYALGWFVGNAANIAHELGGMGEDAAKSGASWQDYALAQEGMNTGTLIAFGAIPPNQLGNYIRENLGTNSAGSPYVDLFIRYIPLWGNRQNP